MAVTEAPAPGFELVALKGGEWSIRSRRHGETMHIGTGPRSEALALHVEQQRLAGRAEQHARAGSARPFVVWDVGLGPAGNALTAIERLGALAAPVEIHSFEVSTDILEFALGSPGKLRYLAGWEATVAGLLREGVALPFPTIRWQLHRGDFREQLHAAPPPAAIFHDPYSPARNPEMWSVELFEAMRARTQPAGGGAFTPCLLTNYTRSTAIRATLALAGWFVGTGVPTGEKTETTIAANAVELLERPLGRRWLDRARASTNAAPFRNGVYAPGPISGEDLARLEALPQFAGVL